MDNDDDDSDGDNATISTVFEPSMATLIDVPNDRFNFVYAGFVLLGSGFLFPYNTYITAVDYFKDTYPASHVELEFTIVYMYIALPMLFFNIFLVDRVSLNRRVYFAYVIFFVALTATPLLEKPLSNGMLSRSVSHSFTLIFIAMVAIGSGVQQGSIYGLAAIFPPPYTQAVMAGEGIAGVIVSLDRIITKAALACNHRGGLVTSTYIYFAFSISLILSCVFTYRAITRSNVASYYRQTVNENNTPHVNDGLDNTLPKKEDEMALLSNGIELSDMTPGSEGHPHDDDDDEYVINGSVMLFKSTSVFVSKICSFFWPSDRRIVLVTVWHLALGNLINFFTTLSVFPGIVTEIRSKYWSDWFPIILITIFNVFDVIGKVLAKYRPIWICTGKHILWVSLVRCAILIPAITLCAAPNGKPIFQSEAWSIFFTSLLGITSGYVGSVAMILGPGAVPVQHKEICGNIMTLSLITGLTLGATAAFGIERIVN